MDWSGLAQDSNQWRALMNTMINFRFHKMLRIAGIAKQETFSSTELASLLVSWWTQSVSSYDYVGLRSEPVHVTASILLFYYYMTYL
jgi:hypothetical protein